MHASSARHTTSQNCSICTPHEEKKYHGTAYCTEIVHFEVLLNAKWKVRQGRILFAAGCSWDNTEQIESRLEQIHTEKHN